MTRLVRWILAWAGAVLALVWAVQAILEHLRPSHVTDPERPELRLRARLSAAEHRAIVTGQDATILSHMYGNEHPAPGA